MPSTKVTAAKASGYLGPFFAHEDYIDKLNEDYRFFRLRGGDPKSLATLWTPLPECTRGFQTSDGYLWKEGLVYTHNKAKVLVLFPELTGHVLDRSIAAYVNDDAKPEFALFILGVVHAAIRLYNEQHS